MFQDILGNVQDIMRSEVRLAKAEIREEISKAAASIRWLAVGGALGIFAVVFVLWAIVYAVGLLLPMWAASLLVGVCLSAIAGAAVLAGVRRLKTVRAVPKRTVETIKENVEWVSSK
jgi:uncharacterized membrane protein